MNRLIRLLALSVGLTAMAACTDSTSPTPTGSLAVSIDGLPAGATAPVTLTKGAVTKVISTSATLEGLDAGAWTVSASPVTIDGVEFAPQPVSQSVNVPANAVGSARVLWGPTTGSLAITVLDLPDGTTADILVQGPGFSRVVTATTRLTALPPGAYVLSARDVRAPGGTYRAAQPSQTVGVPASLTAATATVAYAAAPAAVDVAVSGLPATASAAITLTAPDGGAVAVSGSTRIGPVSAGRWRLAAATVRAEGFTYTPVPAARDTTVSAGDTLRFAVAYVRTTGALAIAITGLPGGAPGNVTVTEPSGATRVITQTTTLLDLTPGTYGVRADSVIRDGFLWRPSPVNQQVTVTPSAVAAGATVAYASVSGALIVSISNVPDGVQGSVRVTGPNGLDLNIFQTTVFSPTPVGTYTLTASPLLVDGIRYDVSPPTVTRTVTIGSRDSVDMRYGNANGTLQLTVDGLPAGEIAAITLSGQSQTINLTGSTTLQNLAPGTYTLAAAIVGAGDVAYAPDVATQSIVIERQVTRAVTVTYRVTNALIDLVLDKAYLTQATQSPDGSVALVAGRDALLRVFARSDRTNALSVPVRARIYDGATLVQTATLTKAAAGVPISINEGTLSASWNVVIAGANVRPSMRVLVDIDPSNAVAEANETNNSWPANGTPGGINVVSVPAFNVRFVPVTVGSLTGNVTTGNMNSYLAFARLVWPLLEVNASVRAPFTSSADTLRANDSNGGWLTVLSELNTLRGTDGAPSNLHYYGVVNVAYSSGIAGYGYVPGRTAMGWDRLPSGDPVAAHEWGHNFDLPHAPCGGASGADPAFPYPGGKIGVIGWNATSNALLQPTVNDLMGYCNPQWVSDYNWKGVLTYRQASTVESAAGADVDGLLVWGRIVDGAVQLEPAFRVKAPATAASVRPTHHVEALDGDGTVLLDLPITADKVDHVTDHDERQFSVVVPWTAALEQSLTRLRVRDVRTPLLTASRASATAVSAKLSRGARTAPALLMPDPDPVLEAAPAGRTRVRWNATQYPMAMVRDAATGDVMGFVRRSGDAIVNGGRTLEVVYSDGVRSVVRRAPTR